jgi:hypothetical protein
MKRQEVVIGNQVFNLGIKEIEESVANKKGKLPTMELEVGDMIFTVGYLGEEKAVALNWWGLTNMRNIVWTRFVFLRFAWPPIKKISAFTYAVEGA